jgi:hypothetical protein
LFVSYIFVLIPHLFAFEDIFSCFTRNLFLYRIDQFLVIALIIWL